MTLNPTTPSLLSLHKHICTNGGSSQAPDRHRCPLPAARRAHVKSRTWPRSHCPPPFFSTTRWQLRGKAAFKGAPLQTHAHYQFFLTFIYPEKVNLNFIPGLLHPTYRLFQTKHKPFSSKKLSHYQVGTNNPPASSGLPHSQSSLLKNKLFSAAVTHKIRKQTQWAMTHVLPDTLSKIYTNMGLITLSGKMILFLIERNQK